MTVYQQRDDPGDIEPRSDSVACPVCNADIGKPCDMKGQPNLMCDDGFFAMYHAERYNKALDESPDYHPST